MDSNKSLRPDPVETTNNLLRLLITHRNDNITLSVTDLNPGYQSSSSAISINSIFFASLSFSLTAAFGAVTAKQWLTEYSNTGLVRALHHQGRERQAKFKGLETWHLRFIMDILPVLLQVSLLLFLIGLIEFLWAIEWKVAAIQLVLSAAGIAVYLTTIIIGVAVPTSPFQTPLSKYIFKFLTTTWRGIEAVGRVIKSGLSAAPLCRFYDVCYSALPESAIRSVIKGVEFYSHQLLRSSRISVFKPTVFKDSTKWDRTTRRAVDCIVWLLEHSEHIDTTIAALDACLRLPTELLLSTINQREGLRERLLGFHRSLLLRSLEQRANRKESLQDLVAISDMALFHLFKLDQDTSLGVEKRSYESRDFGKIPILVELINPSNITTLWGYISPDTNQTLLQPLRLQVDLSDARQTSVTNHLVSHVIPADLWIEAVTCDAIHDFKRDPVPTTELGEFPWRFIIATLQSILENGPAFSTISHVANAIAAVHWRTCPVAGGDRWSYSSNEDQQIFVQSLKNNVYTLDKRYDRILGRLALRYPLTSTFQTGHVE
ncbi:hypothetical protein FRC02_005694 [Tulasnella sp. 418]|nr:hypothetical protein FRC02_005694 [Tulasnella sp. 418]